MKFAIKMIAALCLGSVSIAKAQVAPEVFPVHPVQRREQEHNRKLYTAAVITNGVIKLGVNPEGYLGEVDSDTESMFEYLTDVSLRFIIPGEEGGEYESSEKEGWGASATDVQTSAAFSGFAFSGYSDSGSSNVVNMNVASFVSANKKATSVVDITTGTLRVTHQYKPSTASANSYEGTVTFTNMGSTTLTNLRYRRIIDWNLDFLHSCVSIQGGVSTDLEKAFDDGNYADPDPLGGLIPTPTFIDCPSGNPCSFADTGPTYLRTGADFQFLFKTVDKKTKQNVPRTLKPGEKFSFKIFYGAAANRAKAAALVKAVKAEVYSFAFAKTHDNPGSCAKSDTDGSPGIFFMGFTGVGGRAL